MMRKMLLILVLLGAAATAGAQTGWAPADTVVSPVELPARPVPAQPVPAPEPQPVTTPKLVPVPEVAPVFNALDDSLTVLVDYRAEAEIQRELQNAVAEKALAERNVERGRLLERLAASRIDIKASEIKALEAQIS
ncbi:hypothetical protein FJ250_00400, partial [bacterium]|nr:hypothetical protein [bacterium]